MVKMLILVSTLLSCGADQQTPLPNQGFPFTNEFSLQAKRVSVTQGSTTARSETNGRGCHQSQGLEVCLRASGKEFLFFYRDSNSKDDAKILWTDARYFDENSVPHSVSDFPPSDPPSAHEVIPAGKPGRTSLIPAEKRHWEKAPDGYDYPILDWLLPWDQRTKSLAESEAEVRRIFANKRTVAVEIPVLVGERRTVYQFELELVAESLAEFQRRIANDVPTP